MTTPVNFDTPDRLIRMAYSDAGLVQDGEDPNSEQFANGLNRLNDIINFEQTRGLKIWLQYDLAVTLVAGQGTYTFGPSGTVSMTRPMRILDNGYYLDSNSIRRPLIMMSRDEYTRLSNPTGQGPVTSFFVQKNLNTMDVTFWLVPDTNAATGTAHILIQQQAANFITVTDDLVFPLEWYLWMRWALAAELASGQPQAVIDRCDKYCEGYRAALEDWDVEDASTVFTPDLRMSYQQGEFR